MLSARLQLTILAGSAIAWALLAEGALRLAAARFDTTLFVPDEELGWSLRPDSTGWQVTEGREMVSINHEGFHDYPRSVRKPKDVYRIVVLGNSWTEAMQVPLDQNFCSRLERSLRSLCAVPPGRNVEVLNFGVSGYSTAQQLLQLRSRVWKYEPDMVLLAFYTARDVLNNVREFNTAATPEQAPYFRATPNGLVLDGSFRDTLPTGRLRRAAQDLRFRLASHLRTYEAVNGVLRQAKIYAARRQQNAREKTGAADLENVIYSKPKTLEIRRAWEVTEAILKQMNAEVRAHGARFWMVTLANRAQVEFDPVKRARLAARVQSDDFDYPDRRIQAFGGKEGIPVTSLAAPLRAYAASRGEYLNGFANTAPGEGHWNALGHQAAAETMARAFRELFAGDFRPLGCQLRSAAEQVDGKHDGN